MRPAAAYTWLFCDPLLENVFACVFNKSVEFDSSRGTRNRMVCRSLEEETEWFRDLYFILAEDIILKSTIKPKLFYTAGQTWWVFTIVAL